MNSVENTYKFLKKIENKYINWIQSNLSSALI